MPELIGKEVNRVCGELQAVQSGWNIFVEGEGVGVKARTREVSRGQTTERS